jgi:hypothetical protein
MLVSHHIKKHLFPVPFVYYREFHIANENPIYALSRNTVFCVPAFPTKIVSRLIDGLGE